MRPARSPEDWPESWIAGLNERWSQAARTAAPRFLRLAILRDLSRTIHAGRSSILAGASKASMNELRDLERTVDALRIHDPLERPLDELLRGDPKRGDTKNSTPHSQPGGTPWLRASLIVGPGKLERADRHWELALACEAETQGYVLEAVEATIPMREVEAWSSGLERELWPHAVVLFTESGSEPAITPNRWTGRWWTCFAPNVDAPALIAASQLRPLPRIIEQPRIIGQPESR